MEKIYDFSSRALMALLMIVILGCSQDLTYMEAKNRNERKIEDPEKLEDANFLVDAKSFNLLEKKLSELASTSGYASTIVAMAKQNLKDHQQMEEDLGSLARKEKIVLPTAMNDKHQADYYEIANAERQNFDRNFITLMKRVNEQNTQKFLTMATEAADADIRAFSARKLDMLRAHSQRMEEVEKTLMNTY